MVKVLFDKKKKEWKELEKYSKEGIYFDGKLLQKLKNIKHILKKNWDCVVIVDGLEGCLTGDTMIQLTRNKLSRRYTLKRLYNHYNGNPDKVIQKNKNFKLDNPSYVRAYNGKEIRLHKLKTVHYSGKKKVFLLRLIDGKEIKATATHKFLTRKGWKELSSLKQGQEIMCDKLKSSKSERKKIKLYDIALKVPYHKYKPVGGRVEVHRLIYEARLNNLEFTEYLDLLLNEPDKCKKLKYINPSIYEVHHKDGCHYNNSVDNLELIKKKDHLKHHANGAYQHFSQGLPQWIPIEKITELGIEDTYDIECEEPHHNFVANGIVVHNSGKSTLAISCAWYVSDTNLTTEQVCSSSEEAKRLMQDLPDGSTIVIDEASLLFSAIDVMRKEQKELVKLFNVIRQKRMCLFIVCPEFFRLTSYIACHRSRFLLHVYTDSKMGRGRFAYFGDKKKNLLYILGKKHFNSYSRPRSNFVGTFRDFLPFGDDYLEVKKKALLLSLEPTIKITPKQIKVKTICLLKENNPNMSLDDLAKGSGVTTHTVRRWIRENRVERGGIC